jgi:hypothetical protein
LTFLKSNGRHLKQFGKTPTIEFLAKSADFVAKLLA